MGSTAGRVKPQGIIGRIIPVAVEINLYHVTNGSIGVADFLDSS